MRPQLTLLFHNLLRRHKIRAVDMSHCIRMQGQSWGKNLEKKHFRLQASPQFEIIIHILTCIQMEKLGLIGEGAFECIWIQTQYILFINVARYRCLE